MPIPPFTRSGLLPPYTSPRGPGDSPAFMSPYRCNAIELADRFGTTPHRLGLLSRFLEYRRELRAYGVVQGFQWVDGSFVEALDAVAPPGDIDLVTFVPFATLGIDQGAAVAGRPDLFDRAAARPAFGVDSFFVNLELPGHALVHLSRYLLGLFSHRRDSDEWKGMLELPIGTDADDAGAVTLVATRQAASGGAP